MIYHTSLISSPCKGSYFSCSGKHLIHQILVIVKRRTQRLRTLNYGYHTLASCIVNSNFAVENWLCLKSNIFAENEWIFVGKYSIMITKSRLRTTGSSSGLVINTWVIIDSILGQKRSRRKYVYKNLEIRLSHLSLM